MIMNYQAHFSYGIYTKFATRSHRYFYKKGFLFFKKMNSNFIIRDINVVSVYFAQYIVLGIVSLLNEIAVLILITAGILIYDPKVILLLSAILLPTFLIFYKGVKDRIKRIHEEKHKLTAETSKSLFQSVFGYVDVKISNSEEHFFKKYSDITNRMKNLNAKSYVYNLAPTKVIEIAMVLGILSITIYGLFYLESRSALATLLGVFALSAYRIMPSVNRILLGVMNLRSYQFVFRVLEPIHKEGEVQVLLDVNPLDFQNQIKLDKVSFSYPEEEKKILNSISFEIKKGETIGIIGKSGSGKTTLMNLMLGFLEPESGTFSVDAKKIEASNVGAWRHLVGYVQQEVYMIDATLAENIAFGQNTKSIEDSLIEAAIENASLTELVSTFPKGIKTEIGERGARISGGQRQRVGIARALYSGAEILFFDEATSALDTETEKEITDSIAELSQKNLTMIIIAHRISTLKYCDRIIEMENGEIKNVFQYDELISNAS